ncbi:hypothetical protein J3F84DRAFT_237336 [Trichoderma pleuroticola]
MAAFHDRNYLNEMAKSSKPQPTFEGSQNSSSPTGRHLRAAPIRPPWEHRAQPDSSSFHYRSHPNEMDHTSRSREETRGQQTSIRPVQFTEMASSHYPQESEYAAEWKRVETPLASPFQKGTHLDDRAYRGAPHALLGDSQCSPTFAGRRMDTVTTHPHRITDLGWRGSPEEMARDSQNSSSPTRLRMDTHHTRSRMNHFDDITRRGSSDAVTRGLQNCSSPVSRRLTVPHSTFTTNHEDRKFSISSSLQTDGSEDFDCKCPKEPPRPRNSFMLYRQFHQSAVAKDNKGSSNPEISKIIGTMWKRLADDERKIWTELAEEEKKMHGLKYPGYRYKPNRKPKAQGKQSYRCSKCGGRQNKTTRSAESPGSPQSPESVGSSQSSPSSRTPRVPRGPRGSQGYQGPRTPRTPRTLPTPITPFAASAEASFTTPLSLTGHRNSESHSWPPLNAPNTGSRRQSGITPSLHRIIEQREPRSPRDYGSASPDRRRRRTNDAGDYCATGRDFDNGRRPGLAFYERLATSVVPEPAAFPRSQSLSTLPPPPWQQGTDTRQSAVFGDPPPLPTLEPPLPQTPSWPSLGNYSIHRRLEEKS